MRKIMLLEDEELILQGIRNIIDWDQYSMQIVCMAHNGREALEYLKEHTVDIIISDIHMPLMDGLTFLQEFRESDKRARCILLTGYDEFEYARKAILLDVEDYILKPIDEEKLLEAVLKAEEKLKANEPRTGSIEVNTTWIRFLRATLSEEESDAFVAMLPEIQKGKTVIPALMKLSLDSLQDNNLTDLLASLQKWSDQIRVIYLASDLLLLLCFNHADAGNSSDILTGLQLLQNDMESRFGILTFISTGDPVTTWKELPIVFGGAQKLQKYRIIEGYGTCVSAEIIQNRTSEDIIMDHTVLRKAIFQKRRDDAINYMEDLFINNIKKDTAVDDIYRMAVEIAMLLQDIKAEYHLKNRGAMHNLTDIMEQIYHAEDLFALKALFIGEIVEIIAALNEEHSQYTPVVKQIMAEVATQYQEDMNLKTLAYKYHMNASYLGQIFQKEVGCSFAQYLSNTKNGIAKHMILNTNMRINDIAKAVGYPDTSYFYRKFKQCYGVSPASLREMKSY